MVTVMFDLLMSNVNLLVWGYRAFIKIQEVTAQRGGCASCYPQPLASVGTLTTAGSSCFAEILRSECRVVF